MSLALLKTNTLTGDFFYFSYFELFVSKTDTIYNSNAIRNRHVIARSIHMEKDQLLSNDIRSEA